MHNEQAFGRIPTCVPKFLHVATGSKQSIIIPSYFYAHSAQAIAHSRLQGVFRSIFIPKKDFYGLLACPFGFYATLSHPFITLDLFVLTFFYAITNSRQYLPQGFFLNLLANIFPLKRHQTVLHFLTCKIILLNLSSPNLNTFGARWLPWKVSRCPKQFSRCLLTVLVRTGA